MMTTYNPVNPVILNYQQKSKLI